MEIKITRQKAEWNKSPLGNNKELCVVEFPNQTFKWMPTWRQIALIINMLEECEKDWRNGN